MTNATAASLMYRARIAPCCSTGHWNDFGRAFLFIGYMSCIAVEQKVLKWGSCAKSVEAQTLHIFRKKSFHIISNQPHAMTIQLLWSTETELCRRFFDPKIGSRRRLCALPTTLLEQFSLPNSVPVVTYKLGLIKAAIKEQSLSITFQKIRIPNFIQKRSNV